MLRNRLLALAVLASLAMGAAVLWANDESPGYSIPAPPLLVPASGSTTTDPVLMNPDVLEAHAHEVAEIADALAPVSATTAPEATTTLSPTTQPAEPSPKKATTASTAAPTTRPPATAPPTSSSAGYQSGAESEFASLINSFRSSNGAEPLSRNGSLDAYARSWAKRIAEQAQLSHSDVGSLLGQWSAVAENVGMGGSVGGIFDALAASPGHRDNMLSDFTVVGIGVYRDAGGALWTAHVFAG